MTPVDLLAAPIRSLLDSVGTGTITPGDPTSGLREATAAIDDTDARLRHAVEALVRDWESTAGDRARAGAGTQRSQARRVAEDGATLTDVIEDAVRTVRHAATDLRAILDSFVTAADTLGPALYTPAGVAVVVPIAADHLQRALTVIDRARTELDHHAHRLQSVGRRIAPGSPGDAAAIRSRVTTALGDVARSRAPEHRASGGASTRSASAALHTGDRSSGTGPENAGPPTPGAVPITLPDGSVAYAPNQRAATAVRAALSQRGVPYVWGGTTPGRGLDCSALTQYAYRQAGVELPRLAQDQDTAGFRVDRAELAPGDLAVWSGHVAMYVGNDKMIEAGDPVQISPVRTSNLGQVFEGFYRPR